MLRWRVAREPGLIYKWIHLLCKLVLCLGKFALFIRRVRWICDCNVAEEALFISNLWLVSQAQGILKEYLLAMTTDEQLLNHTAMVRLLHLVCFVSLNNHLCLDKLKSSQLPGSLRSTLMIFSCELLSDVYKSSDKVSMNLEMLWYYATLFLIHAVPLIEKSSVAVSQLAAGVSPASESPSCWHPADPLALPLPLFWMCGQHSGLMYLVITGH